MIRTDAAGRETWYGKWRVGGTQVKRRIGPLRVRGTRVGLTQTQAEAELRRVMTEVQAVPNRGERMTVADVGRALIAAKSAAGRKRSTVEGYDSIVTTHIVPFFGARTVDRIERSDVAAFADALARKGMAANSRVNTLNLLSSMFELAVDRGWAVRNPVRGVRGRAAGPPTRTSDT